MQYVVSNAITAVVLAAVVDVTGRRWRRPAFLHALWVVVLLKLIAPPLIPMPVLGAAPPPASGRLPHGVRPPGAGPDRPESSGVAGGPSTPRARADASGDGPPIDREGFEDRRGSRAIVGSGWEAAALGIGLAGSAVWFGWVAIQFGRFRRLLACSEPGSGGLADRVRECAARIGLTYCPEVLIFPTPVAPMVWGIGRRAWLGLPRALLDEFSREQIETVLTHELAHLRRGDHWVRVLELVVTGLYWWHPVVWWARKQLRRAEEEACDAWVVASSPGVGPTYALALLRTVDLLSRTRSPSVPLASGMGRVAFLKRRLVMIVNENTPRSLSARGRLAVVLLAGLVLPLELARAAPPRVPTLDEVRAGLDRRHEKIRGIDIEAKGETTNSLAKEDLDWIPQHIRRWGGSEVRYRYAAKGEKRYSRKVEAGGDWDQVRAYDGASVWERIAGKASSLSGEPTVRVVDAGGMDRFLYPNAWYGVNLGAVIAGPELKADRASQDILYLNLPDLKERWSLRVSDRIEEVDGAPCVVLSGTIEMSLVVDKKPQERFRFVKCWLDLQHDLALRKWEEGDADREPWLRVVTSDLRETEQKVWIPREVELQLFATPRVVGIPREAVGKTIQTTRIRVTNCRLGDVPEELFNVPK